MPAKNGSSVCVLCRIDGPYKARGRALLKVLGQDSSKADFYCSSAVKKHL